MHREPNAFWRFSLHAYRLPGVEAACLALQDGWATDTNLLLYCCWLGSAGRPLDKRILRRAMAAVARLQAEVIQPLRQVRRGLKTTVRGPCRKDAAPDLRKRIAAVELDLEYLEQCALFQLAQTLPPLARRQPPRAAAQASIERYLALLQVPPAALARQHAETLLDACFATPRRRWRAFRPLESIGSGKFLIADSGHRRSAKRHPFRMNGWSPSEAVALSERMCRRSHQAACCARQRAGATPLQRLKARVKALASA